MATTTETFTTPGANNWYAPHNASNVVIEAWGAGGAGANRNSNGSGGGGAGGAYAKNNSFPATPGNSYPYSVGTGGNTNNNSHGTDTSFNTTTVVARGGNTAGRNNATGQTANAVGNSTGDVVYRGGNGASGASNNGGGGGSSGGNNGNGVDGVGNNGGIASLPGGAGAGGNGAKTGSAVGVAGSAPGGAGGGATRNSGTNRSGGNGANGQLKITYDYTPNAISLNGSGQYGSIANFAAIDDLTDWYMETWIKRSSSSAAYAKIFGMDNDTDTQFGMTLESGSNSDGVNFHQRYATTDADGYIANGGGAVPSAQWIHIGLRHSGSGLKYTTVIINGRPWKTYGGDYPHQGVGAIQTLADGILRLGHDGSDFPDPDFTGSVGGFFRFWNRWLTNAEIYKNYQNTLTAANESGLVVNINFTEGSGTTLDNEAGGNDMTLTGSPSWVAGPATSAKSYGNTYLYKQVLETTAATPTGDDAEEDTSSHDTWIDSGDTEFTLDGAIRQTVGVRFQGITIPQGATITHAYLRLISAGSYATGTCDVTLKGEDVDNSSVFSAGSANSNISGRTVTTASVSWGIPANSDRELVSSPDIASIIQEIVDRGGWSSGNALSIIVTGSDSDIRNYLSADLFPYDLGWSIEIEYVASSVTDKPITDTGAASDAVDILVLVAQSDTAVAVDAISLLNFIAVTDAAGAVDTVSILALLSLSDAATAVDAVEVLGIIAQTDTASATEALQILAFIAISDSAVAVDALDILAQIAITDTGSAVDAVEALPSIDVNDTGSASDALAVTAFVAVSDTAQASDAISILAEVAMSDNATAVDAVSILALIAVSDAGTADDAMSVLAMIAESDSAQATDALTILAMIAQTDTASASDAIDILNQLSVSDSAVASDALEILNQLAVADMSEAVESLNVTNFLNVTDIASMNEAIELMSLVGVVDAGSAEDNIAILIKRAIGSIRNILGQRGRGTMLSQKETRTPLDQKIGINAVGNTQKNAILKQRR